VPRLFACCATPAASAGRPGRRCCWPLRISASALRYEPRTDHSAELRQKTVVIAQRHRSYGAAMIYLKLRQAGERVNHKRAKCAELVVCQVPNTTLL
jgi:hypothetical protein